jgi:hypothetical protein
MSIKNGGFPPIKFCVNEDDKNNINNKKERFYQNNLVHNINVRQLLTEASKKPILTEREEGIEVIESLDLP